MRSVRGLSSSLVALALVLGCACKGGSTRDAETVPPQPVAAATAPAAPEADPAPATVTRPVVEGVDVATGRRGAVTSAEQHATAVGRKILEQGGNAVDAAIAIGFALSVTHPSAGNIGGGGFMVIRLADGTSTALDFREVAPGKASRDMYLDKKGQPTMDSRLGPRAAGIPGNVAGFAMAHAKYGSLPWKDLVMPAVELARAGHELDKWHADDMAYAVKEIDAYVAELKKQKKRRPLIDALEKTRALFVKPGGDAYAAGETWTEPELAATLETIAADATAFYRGPMAKKMAAEVAKMGGLWTAQDLAGYQPIEREPIVFDYRGHTIITMPPPSAGGITLRQVFAANEILKLRELPWDSVDRIHLYIESLRRIYADRNLLVGDPAFVDVPIKTLLDVEYLTKRMSDIDREHATPSSKVGAGVELEEKPETTHFSVIDASGTAVATTYTLNGGFGAKVAVPGTGVLLNNEMDDFTAKVGAPNMFGLIQGPQNGIAPGKRMVSSMTPTIVTRGNKLRAVCGSPGGPTITTTVAQILLQMIDHGRGIDEAIAATRIHHQWLPDVVLHEESLPKEIAEGLEARGHVLKSRPRIGHANCIEVDASGEYRAVADTRRDGGDADAF